MKVVQLYGHLFFYVKFSTEYLANIGSMLAVGSFAF